MFSLVRKRHCVSVFFGFLLALSSFAESSDPFRGYERTQAGEESTLSLPNGFQKTRERRLPIFYEPEGASEFGLQQIFKTKLFPYSAVGRISSGCTGTLVGPRHVLTAAHCVYHPTESRWLSELEFSPGQNAEARPFGTVEWEKVYVPAGWKESNDPSFDFALIILKESIGQKTGWFGFGVHTEAIADGISITGYPGGKPMGTQWQSRCPLLDVYWQGMDYRCETQGGMSGAGVVLYDPAQKNNLIIGIHTLGEGSYNSAVRINGDIYELLAAWKALAP